MATVSGGLHRLGQVSRITMQAGNASWEYRRSTHRKWAATIDDIEFLFDYWSMTVNSLRPVDDGASTRSERIHELQQRVHRMQGTTASHPLPTVPALTELVQLRTGASYAVDRPVLAMALMAGPSAAGSWSAVIGAGDFGVEAAAELGVDLERTVLVTDPGDAWLEATAALADVMSVIVVRTPEAVTQHQASRLAARLRKRDAMLVAVGDWPRADARLSIQRSSWSGIGRGHGRLTGHRAELLAELRTGQRRMAELWLPGPGEDRWGNQEIRAIDPDAEQPDRLSVVRAG